MIYAILKTIIETTITQYVCQNCSGKIDDSSIVVLDTNDNQVHLEIVCPHCKHTAHIHAEVATIQAHITTKDKAHTSGKPLIPKNENAIKEEDIQMITQSLESKNSVKDLLNES